MFHDHAFSRWMQSKASYGKTTTFDQHSDLLKGWFWESHDKRHRMLCELELVKETLRQPPQTKANILNRQNLANKYMKINFSKVIFSDESRMTFDRPDGCAKGWILLNSEVLVAKRRQLGGGSVMIWAGIVDQTIIRHSK